MSNLTLTKKLTLKELIETEGFKKVFSEMADYSQREKSEARVECWHPRLVNPSSDRLTYSISFGNEKEVSLMPEKAYNSTGELQKTMPNDKHYYTILKMHTHIPFSYESPLQLIRFSEADIESHIAISETATDGVVVFPSKTLARCLLWQPSPKLEGFGEMIYQELERCMKESEPDRAAVAYLNNFGKSETIDFKFKKGVWVPESKHLDRLKQFEVKED